MEKTGTDFNISKITKKEDDEDMNAFKNKDKNIKLQAIGANMRDQESYYAL